jgi:hypothetical protein
MHNRRKADLNKQIAKDASWCADFDKQIGGALSHLIIISASPHHLIISSSSHHHHLISSSSHHHLIIISASHHHLSISSSSSHHHLISPPGRLPHASASHRQASSTSRILHAFELSVSSEEIRAQDAPSQRPAPEGRPRAPADRGGGEVRALPDRHGGALRRRQGAPLPLTRDSTCMERRARAPRETNIPER